jgi:hypothetical protein
MRLPLVMGAALMLAPAVALADETQPSRDNPSATSDTGSNATADQGAGMTTQKLLPKDVTLVGSVATTEVRTFPEQMGKGEGNAKIEKENVVGVGALDRTWTTKQTYNKTVSYLEQQVKEAGIEPIAKTTTRSATAWNLRMPDGHIANVVVRNTQPTTIEAVQLTAVAGSSTREPKAAPTPKTKNSNDLK